MPAAKFFGEPDPSFSVILTRKLTIIYQRVRSWPVIAKRLGVSRQMLVYCRSGLKSPGHPALKRIDDEYFKCWTQLKKRASQMSKRRAERIAEGTLGLSELERQAELHLRNVDLTSRRQVNILRPNESTSPESVVSDQVVPAEGVDLHPGSPETAEPALAEKPGVGDTRSGNPPPSDHEGSEVNEPPAGAPA